MAGTRRVFALLIVALLVAPLVWPGAVAVAAPSIQLSSQSGAPGSTVRATITGLPASSSVRLRWDGLSLAQASASSRGRATVTFGVPETTGGAHTIRATAGQTSVEATFLVVPSLEVDTNRLRSGEGVTVTMRGFGAGERITLSLVKGKSERRIGSVTASDSGSRSRSITLPADLASGTWKLVAQGGSGAVATAKVTVSGRVATATPTPSPTATLSPTPAATATAGAGGTVSIWVDPVNGRDDNDGARRGSAVRTLAEAWSRVPAERRLTTGYRIRLVAGAYPASGMPNYLERRYGTIAAPITIEAADGAGTATLNGHLNIYDVSYLSLVDLVIRNDGDVVHCEQCRHFAIRDSVLDGEGNAHETLKINQSQHVTIDGSDIGGSYENAIDFVAVQYGSITGNKIHDAADWCIYLKGGSAEFVIEGNEIYNCGTGGFSAGQGTGFQFMTAPWITYEAEAIEFVRNEIHDVDGAGMGVNGGRDILLAENHLVRVGARSHLLEVTFGSRSCDGRPGDEGRSRCADYLEAGGWGTTAVDDGDNYVRIPNKDVMVRDNRFENPSGYQTRWQHFFIPGPYSGAAQAGSNAPNPALADDGLVITGNTIVNGDAAMPLGIGDGQGCADTNPTCNEAQLLADNDINGR